MKIITFANYDFSDIRYLTMGLMWMESACQNFPGEIVVQSKLPIGDIFRPHMQSPDRIHFLVDETQYLGPLNLAKYRMERGKADHNIRYKMYHLSQQQTPFMYIDLDTVILNPLSTFIEAYPDRRIVFPTRNGGIMLVNDPAILDYASLLRLADSENFQPKELFPEDFGAEQTIYWEYFNRETFLRHREWNAWSLWVKVYKKNNRWCARLWDCLKPVHIIHYFSEGRPWKINCPIYQERLNELPQTPRHIGE